MFTCTVATLGFHFDYLCAAVRNTLLLFPLQLQIESKQRSQQPKVPVGDETVLLKINEDDLCDGGRQHHQQQHSSKKDSLSTDWTSEESMLRGVATIDEDNK